MVTLRYSVRIAASKEVVWQKMEAFDDVATWTQGVKKSYYTGDKRGGVGTQRACETPGFGTVREEVTRWVPLEGYTYEAKVPMMKSARNTWLLKADGDDSIVTIEPTFEVRFGFLGKLMTTFMLKPQLRKQLPVVLAEFKYYVENGRPATKDNQHELQLASVF